MAMPKAAMNKNHGMVLFQYYVRLSGQSVVMNPKTKAKPV